MKLNQFLSIMEQYFSHKVLSGSGSGRVTKADKLKAYLNAFVSSIDSDNPIENKKDGFLLKIYNGVESLPVDCASYIKENLDYYTFSSNKFHYFLDIYQLFHMIYIYTILQVHHDT